MNLIIYRYFSSIQLRENKQLVGKVMSGMQVGHSSDLLAESSTIYLGSIIKTQ